MKKLLLSLMFASLLIGIGLGLFVMSDVNGKTGGEEIIVSVPKGSGSSYIADILADNDVIKSGLVFKLYTKLNPATGLQYGEFQLAKGMSYDEIIAALQVSADRRETISVTIPEGFSLIQIARRMENNGLCTEEEFIEVANTADFSQFEFWNKIVEHDHKFLKGEGYLYPETYEFFKDESVYNIIAKLYKTFDEKITPEMYDRMDEIGMSLDEVITLASFVQEEAGHSEDQYYVAACLRNRLKPNASVNRLECNVCSYINEPGNYVYDYIVPYYGGVNNVPAGMMDAYDTYKIAGLPPSPISNPGIDAIKNTLWPAEDFNDYYYFVTDLTGKYYYSRTYAEHLVNVDKAWEVNRGLN